MAIQDDAVGGDVVAGADANDIADGELTGGDFFLGFVSLDSPGFGGSEFDERLDGVARAFSGAGLDEFAEQHEERDDASGLVIAGRKRREHGDGDEFVDAEFAELQILDSRADDGIAENDRADHRARARHDVRRIEDPIHDEGVDDEDEAEEHPAEADVAVGVVVAAAGAVFMVVVAQE